MSEEVHTWGWNSMGLVTIWQVWKLIKDHDIVGFQNNLGFNLYAVPSACCLVAISEVKVDFNRRNTDKKKYVDLILKICYNLRLSDLSKEKSYIEFI